MAVGMDRRLLLAPYSMCRWRWRPTNVKSRNNSGYRIYHVLMEIAHLKGRLLPLSLFRQE